LLVALACYFLLILVALFAFLPIRSREEGYLLGFVLCLFAILIVKTLVHAGDEEPE
jgi:Ca2+/Na+ antiporter